MSAPHNKTIELDHAAGLALARQGADAWNAWAEDPVNLGASVYFFGHDFTDDPIDFSGFIFPGPANFNGCTFGDNAMFDDATFEGEADFLYAKFEGDATFFGATFEGGATFSGATFNGGATLSGATFDVKALFNNVTFGVAIFHNATFDCITMFQDATFGGSAIFHNATFDKMAIFSRAQFDRESDFSLAVFSGTVYLDGAVFKSAPELRFTKIATHFTLHGVQVKYANSDERAMWLGLSWAKAARPDDVDRYRRLKELAMAAKDHQREQNFFALELKAKRHYEILGWALLLNYAYELFSGFGRSVMRPLAWLIVVWLGFGVGHGMFAKLEAGAPWLDGLRLSTAVLLPFVSSARTIYEGASKALYDETLAYPWALDFAVVTESALGLLFLFLLGLGLRNRFRL